MSDISTPAPTPAPVAETPKPKKQLLDNLAIKSMFTLLAWLSPLPVAVVLLKFWFTNFAPEDQSGTDPFQSIRHTVTSPSGSTPDMILLQALIPAALLLVILHRTVAKRIFAIAALLMIATGELLMMIEITGT